MNKIKEILYIIIAIILGILTVKFVIWLIPVILIALISYYIYKSITKTRKQPVNKTKKKTIKIIDMEENK